jgi:hypothetical protein
VRIHLKDGRVAAAVLATSLLLGLPTARWVRGATATTLPAAKRAYLDADARDRQAALQQPPAPKTYAPPERPTEPAWVRGIIDSGQAPFPSSVYSFTNQWQDVVNGEHANVYAGSLRSDRSQGIVALEFTAIDITGPATQGGVYATPTRSGALRIVAASAGRLIVLAENGARFAFDLSTRSFAVQ